MEEKLNASYARKSKERYWTPSLYQNISPSQDVHYQSFFNLIPPSGTRESFLYGVFKKSFDAFERYFDAKIKIKMPLPVLAQENFDCDPELLPLIRFASQLHKEDILEKIEEAPNLNDEPPLFRFRGVLTQNPKSSVRFSAGHSLFSRRDALAGALGETVERYCFREFSPHQSELLLAPYTKIKQRALDPSTVAGIDPALRLKNIDPRIRPFDEHSVFTWIQGHSLTQKKEIWFPVHLMTVNPSFQEELQRKNEPFLRFAISTGFAAGQTSEEAIYRGICEVIERDAYMITYLNRLSPPQIDINDFKRPELTDIKEKCERYGLTLHLLRLPTDIPCHVILAFISSKDKQPPYFSIGMKADLDLENAVEGAIRESLNQRINYRFKLGSLDRSQIPAPHEVAKINQFERVDIWQTQSEFLPRIEFLTKGVHQDFDTLPHYLKSDSSPAEKIAFLTEFFKENKMEVIYKENTTPNLVKIYNHELWAARSFCVFIPQLQPLHLKESIPYFSGERIKKIPRKLGYDVDDLINTFPHPFP